MRILECGPKLQLGIGAEQVLAQHMEALGMIVVMEHGWITTLSDSHGNQFSVMTQDRTAPVNPDISIFVGDAHQAHARARTAGVDIVHQLTEEPWGVSRFFYCDDSGTVINVGMHTA